ncbi:hypothetical protein [Telluria aromaticivorans]|uniref:Uncharacterized protein n=1 Tax=Telluria aromaticivorans TaxID=2725995 RepID=A0A7Y2JZ20_9BURK|nr:hypothetical protein [Telluria aromaticivorans]NNG23378.1 hypothetical protein [Telluria aromaticivorans]
MRPNLMSPRRTSGEDSILAMLERDPMRKRGTGAASGGRLAWYGASGAVAFALTGMLVWLAAGNDGVNLDASGLPLDQPVLAGAAPPAAAGGRSDPPPPALPEAAPALRQVAMAATTAPPVPRPGGAAVIVDQEPAHDVPPMRVLKPAPAKPATLPPVRVPVPVAAPRPMARTPASKPATLATGEPRQAARPLASPARPRPVAVARNAVRPAQAKAQRPASPAKGADGHVDADVALISAVIVHANGHAPEGSQMTELLCPNGACKAKPQNQ